MMMIMTSNVARICPERGDFGAGPHEAVSRGRASAQRLETLNKKVAGGGGARPLSSAMPADKGDQRGETLV